MQKNPGKEEKIITDTISQVDLANSFGTSFAKVLTQLDEINTKTGGILGNMKTIIEEMESQVNSVSRLFAGSQNLAQITRDTLRDATPSVTALGGTLNDVAKIQTGILSGLHTQASLNTDQYDDLYASAALVGDSTSDLGTNAANIAKTFVDAGYGLNNVGQEMVGILNTSKSLGVTAKSVFEAMKGSMDSLAKYNFEGGVQGMAKMAAQASLLRIDMKSTLTLADALFEPQKAIEMSAAFQRLGVQVSSLLDPYKLMDMARNDPEKLQEEMGKALKSLTYFDEKTQSMRILPGAQGHLRELQKETGINMDQMTKWALSAGDLDRKMKEITFNPDFADEDSRKMIAGMATLGEKGGKFEGMYTVKYQDKEGETQEKLVSEVKKEDLEAIQKANAPAKSAVDLQVEANGYLKTLANLAAARQGVAGRTMAADPKFVSGIQDMAKTMSVFQETINNAIGLQREGTVSGDKQGFLTGKAITENMASVSETVSKVFSEALSGNFTSMVTELAKIPEALKSLGSKTLTNVPGDFQNAENRYGVDIPVEKLTKILDSSEVKGVLEKVNISVDDIKKKILGNGTQNVNGSTIQNAGVGSTIVPSTVLPSQIVPQSTIAPQTPSIPETGSVKVDGSISVNVNPVGMESFVMDMLAKSDVASAIYQANSRTERMSNDLKGSGNNKAQAGNLFSPTTAYS